MRRMAAHAIALVVLFAAAAPAAAAGLLVDVDWLRAQLDRPDIRIIDMASKPETYAAAHVPGALYLHVNDARVFVPAGGFRLPTVEEGERLLRALGIAPDTHVVIYDDAGGLHAARLFFTLDVMRHGTVSLVDGGIQAWQRAGFPLTAEVPAVHGGGYRPRLDSERVVTASFIRDRLGDPMLALVDARTPAEYAGRDVRAKRGGHIPSAVNVEWTKHLRPDGRFKPLDELRALFAGLGVTPEKMVVTYCQTHHRGAHSYFVLRMLGYPRVAGYDRSWIEWGNRDDLPVAKD